MLMIATIKCVNDETEDIKLGGGPLAVPRRSQAFPSDLPAAPDYNPVRRAAAKTEDPEIASALALFASMPPSTGVFANPVRYRQTVACNQASVELNIRSFGIRGCLLEEDIVRGSADAERVIFVGLFGRFATVGERKQFSRVLSQNFRRAVAKVFPTVSKFMKSFPDARAEVAMQYVSSLRKAVERAQPFNALRPPADVLADMIAVHMENAAAGACASYMRAGRRQGNAFSSLCREAIGVSLCSASCCAGPRMPRRAGFSRILEPSRFTTARPARTWLRDTWPACIPGLSRTSSPRPR